MSSKKQAVYDALMALRRGVQQPKVVVDEDGDYEYIPGAYLNDASYTNEVEVVHEIDEDGFGPEFDLSSDDDCEQAAEWAAESWEWPN